MTRLSRRFRRRFRSFLREVDDPEWKIYYRASWPKYARIVRSLPEVSELSVLELGASRFSALLKELNPGWQLEALDVSDHNARYCHAAGIPFHQGDLLQPLPLEDSRYDVVLYSEVIEHLQGNPRTPFPELLRILKPGGRLILTTVNLARTVNRLKLLAGRTPMEWVGAPGWAGHIREYAMDEVLDFLRSGGFEVDHAEYGLYWDTPGFYLACSGQRNVGAFRPRFRGWRKLAAWPLLAAYYQFVRLAPSWRHALYLVARKPIE